MLGDYEAQELGGHNNPGKSGGDGGVLLPPGVAGASRITYNPEVPVLDPDRPRTESEVAEEVRETWLRGAMDTLQAGKEIPIRDIPLAIGGDMARLSEEATGDLYRKASTRRFSVNVDIKALEAARRRKLAAVRAAAEAAAADWITDVLQRPPWGGQNGSGVTE